MMIAVETPLDPSAAPVPAPAPKARKRIVMVDDSSLCSESWRAVLTCRYGEKIDFESYQDPIEAVRHFGPDIDLLLLDLELPVLDGRKLLAIAKDRGVPCRRIVILSGHHADELHQLFPPSSCLAVINKTEQNQQQAFFMILDSIMRK